MAQALLTMVLNQLATILVREAEQEVRQVVGVKKEVHQLSSTLLRIQAVLDDAEKRQVKDKAMANWLDDLKDISYDIDNVLDEWNSAILKAQIGGVQNTSIPPLSTVRSFIASPCFCLNRVVLRHDIAKKIKDLNKSLQVIDEQKAKFSFSPTSRSEESDQQRIITTPFIFDESKIRGREHDKDALRSVLLRESSEVISIVGMGGIGKTTLAKLAYNDDKVKTNFGKRIWVCVSDPFTVNNIARSIFEALNGTSSNCPQNLEVLFDEIYRSINRFKFLLVLDDVWNVKDDEWEPLKCLFNFGVSGSKILVTTRKDTVARIVGCTEDTIFPLGGLSNEECWSVFNEIAFSGRSTSERENLEDIGRKIADKCKGLPLAVKVLGGLLRFKKNQRSVVWCVG